MYLVLIETSGNQHFIFSTNKLKENIGASQLTYLAGTKWVIDAVAQVDGNARLALWTEQGSEELRNKLLDPKLNPPIEKKENRFQVEIIIAASGKAMLLVKENKYAKAIIGKVTQKALEEAPGLDICGVIHEFNWKEEQSLPTAISDIHKKFEVARSRKPSPDLRFLRLPVVEDCSTSGLPASHFEPLSSGGESTAISAVSKTKRESRSEGYERIELLLQRQYPEINFARSIRVLDQEKEQEQETSNNGTKKIEWFAVIHADGNGLGQIFLNFHEYLKKLNSGYNNRYYVDKLRDFSLALDACTEKAFLSAIQAVFTKENQDKKLIPIVPLILGGDDLTVICDGKFALPFTQKFLQEFEEETQQNEIIAEIAQEALSANRLSACAGVAIIKPHFPFSVAYELAEALTKSAKKVKEIVIKNEIPYPCSAIDFHVVYDTSGVELSNIRKHLELEINKEKNKLYRRPYVVTPETELQEAQKGKDWVRLHHWGLLEKYVGVITAQDEVGKRQLPNTQVYQLREGLFLGKDLADARYKLIKERYKEQGITQLEGDSNSLFSLEELSQKDLEKSSQNTSVSTYITGILDAIEAADFLGF